MALLSNSLYSTSLTIPSETVESTADMSRRCLGNLLDATDGWTDDNGKEKDKEKPPYPQPVWRASFAQAVGTPPKNPIGAIGTPPQNPIGPICTSQQNSSGSAVGSVSSLMHGEFFPTSGLLPLNQDTPSGTSSGTSSSVSAQACSRCEDHAPFVHCVDCHELYCRECAYISTCQQREHILRPLSQPSPPQSLSLQSYPLQSSPPQSYSLQSSPPQSYSLQSSPPQSFSLKTSFSHPFPLQSSASGVGAIARPYEKTILCDVHADPTSFYCTSCTTPICLQCKQWNHKEHTVLPFNGAFDIIRNEINIALDTGRQGTAAIKSSIDRAVAIRKVIEKDAAEVSTRIKRTMRLLIKEIEDREKYLLEKVDRLRQTKVNELSEQMDSLRGILSGLAHNNDLLTKSLEMEGIDIFATKDKCIAQMQTFADMYKTLIPKDDHLLFITVSNDFLERLKNQCNVIPASLAQSMENIPHGGRSQLQSANSLLDISRSSMLKSLTYYNGNVSTAYNTGLETNNRGAGRAILGYGYIIRMKPLRSRIPGMPIISFGHEGPEDGCVARPWGLCVDKEGNILVADRRNNRIQMFTSDGKLKHKWGAQGPSPGNFELPAGITTDKYGRIIVIDKDNHRVQIFNSSGGFQLTFGCLGKEDGEFQYPWDVAVNTLGNIAVTDTRNHRVQLFSPEGRFLTKFNLEGTGPNMKGPTTPRGVCFMPNGNLIVTDFENHRLLVLDPSLTRILRKVGSEGHKIDQFNRPSGIKIDDDGRVIVADSKNHRVVVLSPDLVFLWELDFKTQSLGENDRPSDVALTHDGHLVVLFEIVAESSSLYKQFVRIY